MDDLDLPPDRANLFEVRGVADGCHELGAFTASAVYSGSSARQ